MTKGLLRGLAYASAFAPLLAFAQSLPGVTNLLGAIEGLVRTATPVLIGIALLVFFWGLIKFIFSSGDEEGRKQARGYMIGGVVALFVMVSIFGLIVWLRDQFGITDATDVELPGVL